MKEKDLKISETKQVIATYSMAAEALDIKLIDNALYGNP